MLPEVIGLAAQLKHSQGTARELSAYRRLNNAISEAARKGDRDVESWRENHIFPLEMIMIKEIRGKTYLLEIHLDASQYRMLRLEAYERNPHNPKRGGIKYGEGHSYSPMNTDWAIDAAVADFEQNYCAELSQRERTVTALQHAFGIGPGGLPAKNETGSKLIKDLARLRSRRKK